MLQFGLKESKEQLRSRPILGHLADASTEGRSLIYHWGHLFDY
jgi:hypothetical protein